MGNDGEEQDEVHNMINLLDKRCVRSGDKKISARSAREYFLPL